MNTCIRNTRYAWLADFFTQGVPKLAVWRWGVVEDILAEILASQDEFEKGVVPKEVRYG